jgi:hypothetical protein
MEKIIALPDKFPTKFYVLGRGHAFSQYMRKDKKPLRYHRWSDGSHFYGLFHTTMIDVETFSKPEHEEFIRGFEDGWKFQTTLDRLRKENKIEEAKDLMLGNLTSLLAI